MFLTPGILTVDPTEATTRIAQIKGLASFTPLVTYMTQNLSTTPLNTLLTQDTLTTLLGTCIDDFLSQTIQSVSAQPNGRAVAPSPQFTASWGLAPTYLVNVTNSGLRFDSVVKQDLLADLSENGSPVLLKFHTGLSSELSGVLDGPSLISWGSILTFSALQPATDSVDINIQNDPTTAIVRLWIYGPGFAGAATTPADVDAQASSVAAWGMSILYYLVFPLIDFRIGKAELLGKGIKIVSDVWTSVQAHLNVVSFLNTLQNGKLTSSSLAALIDVVIAGVVLAPLILKIAGIVVPPALTGFVALLTLSAVLMALPNVQAVIKSWDVLPSSSYFDLIVSSGGITVK